MTGPAECSFWVSGVPAPQGSKRYVGNKRMVEQVKAVKPWREAVHHRTLEERAKVGRFEDGPLHLHLVFHLPHGKQRETSPWKRLDIDKLTRAVGDSLKTGGLIIDDSRITTLHAHKIWAVGDTGVHITIRRNP